MVRDLTSEVAGIRQCMLGRPWDPDNAFPRMAAYPDIPCEHVFKRTLDLARVHADAVRAGHAPRISACCQVLQNLARREAARALEVYRGGRFIAGKPEVDMPWARSQAKWLRWLVNDAIRDGRKLKGRETDLAIDVLGLIHELIQYMPWEKLPRNSLRHRAALVGWFGEEIKRITAPPSWRPSGSPNEPTQTTSAPSDPAGPSRGTGDSGCSRRATENV